jgi:hypothetical protein
MEPITLYKGIPILVTCGYSLAGLPENSREYFKECFKEGGWRTVKYAEVDSSQIEQIIEDFIKTTKWRTPLASEEKLFLKKQAAL